MNQEELPKYDVRPTEYGLGLFTPHYYSPGIVIAEVTGELSDDPDYTSEYCVDMGGPYSLEIHAPFRYLNHSCNPNCELVVFDEEDQFSELQSTQLARVPKLYLETIGEIQPDEQLTIDYAWPASAAIECLCGSRDCRGWIVAEEIIDNILQSKDLDPFSTDFTE